MATTGSSQGGYYSSAAIGSTALACFRDDGPLIYRGRYVTRDLPPREADANLAIGIALHEMVEGWGLDGQPGESPIGRSRLTTVEYRGKPLGRRQGATWDAAVAEHGPGGVILAHERALALNLYLSLLTPRTPMEEQAADLIRTATAREAEVFWRHESGLECRSKHDLRGDAWFADIKSYGRPIPPAERYGDGLARFGGIYQLGLYDLGFESATGLPAEKIFHLVASKEPPYEWGCFEIDAEDIAIARRQVGRDLAELSWCYENDKWWRRAADESQSASLPAWWRRKHEERIWI